MRALRIASFLGVFAVAAASPAFADISLSNTGSLEGDSFREDFTASASSSGTNTDSFTFDTIKVYLGGNVTFNVSSGSFSITNAQSFEDSTAGNGNNDNSSGDHDGIAGFEHSATGTANGWVQTFFTTSYMEASGTDVASGSGESLDFSIWFAGSESDGGHAFIEFWDGGTFRTGYEYKVKLGGTPTGGTFSSSLRGVELVNYTVAVPMPAAFWCGLFMMGGLGAAYAVKRRQRVLA
jgi:hypothetical protein